MSDNEIQSGTTSGTVFGPGAIPQTGAVEPATKPARRDLMGEFSAADAALRTVEAATTTATAAIPGLVVNTASAINPNDVKDPGIVLVTLVLDTSHSMIDSGLVGVQLLAHDFFIQSLIPVLKKGLTILVMCTGLNGHVFYRFTRLQDVTLFGRKPEAYDTETPQSTGLVYKAATADFEANHIWSGSALYDRMVAVTVASREEAKLWIANGRVPQVINTFITDGFELHSKLFSHETTAAFFDELSEDGNTTVQLAYIGAGTTPGTPEYDNWRGLFLKHCNRKGLTPPANWENTMSNEELLTWLFRGIVKPVPANGEPREIRRVMGLFSAVARDKSQLAGKGDEDETDSDE